jgi:HEAT repeat protein
MNMLAGGSLSVNGSSKSKTADAARIRWAIGRLRSRHRRDRAEALQRLADAGAPAELVVPSLRDSSPEVRLAAITALRRSTADQLAFVTHHLLSAIDDRDARVVGAAIHALKVLRVEEARPEIIVVLDDWCRAAEARPGETHPFCIAKAAVGFLAELGPSEAAEHLLPLLRLPWPEIRRLGIWGIVSLRFTPPASHLIEALDRVSRREGRSGADYEELRSWIRLIVALRAVETVPTLLRIAREAVGFRSIAVEALAALAPERAAAELVHMLDDPAHRLRCNLLSLMVRAGHVEALPRIRAMLDEDGHEIRRAAISALVGLNDLGAAERIRSLCFTDPHPFVRPQAVDSLVALVGKGAIPTLEGLANDTNARVRERAGRHLERLRSGSPELEWMAGHDPSPGDVRQQDEGEGDMDRLPDPGKAHGQCKPAMCP